MIQALAGNISRPPCQTLGLQVTTCWWGGGQQGSLKQTGTRSLYEFWEVYSEYATCKYVCSKDVFLVVQVGSAGCSRDSSLLAAAKHSAAVALLVVSMSDRFGFSDLAASVAELQPMPCIVIATKVDAVQSWAMTLVGPYLQYAAGCMMLVPELTLCDTVKADVNRMAKEQNLPVYLMGVTSAGSSGTIDCQAKLGIHPTMDCVQTAVMSQILSSANAGLW